MVENISQNPVEENKIEENEALKSFLGEDVKETHDTPQTEKNTKEDPVLPSTEEIKPVSTEPDIPLEDITREVIKKTKDEVKADILRTLGMTQEEKESAEDQGYKFPWEKRGENEGPKDYKEVFDAFQEYQLFKKVEQDKILNENKKSEMAAIKDREAEINTEWDVQLDYLREEGLIPRVDDKIQKKLSEGKILSQSERDDPGIKAQVALFEAMYNVAQEREMTGKSPITDLIHIHSRYYRPTKESTGANAPVSGGSSPVSNKEEDIPYEKLHNARGFEDLL